MQALKKGVDHRWREEVHPILAKKPISIVKPALRR
jgi:hypothetical protein